MKRKLITKPIRYPAELSVFYLNSLSCAQLLCIFQKINEPDHIGSFIKVMIPDKQNSVKRSLKSFSYAWKGLKIAIKTQSNFRIQTILALVIIFTAFLFKFNLTEWIILIVIITMVLVTELINTAIEVFTDHIFPDYHETAGRIKDISAAAVLITAIAALIAGILLFLPKII